MRIFLPDLSWITSVIRPEFLAAGWFLFLLYVARTAVRTRIYGLLVIGFVALPWSIFYLFAWRGLFPSHEFGIAYSRMCHVSSLTGLFIGMHMMYLQTIDGRKHG